MIRFLLNDKEVSTDLAPGSSLLDYIRLHKRLTGTKTGCREGDCGACTILVGNFENGRLLYRSATSCLMPLGNAAGKHIVTVEGLNMNGLSPVQQAMVDTNGTQCGFCTLGFVTSFTGFVLHPHARSYEEAIASVDGNICRCTGYKSIERAAAVITHAISAKPANGTTAWLVEQGFLPAYFTGVEERLRAMQQPTTPAPAGLPLGGGTDLIVQRPHQVKETEVRLVADDDTLKTIEFTGNRLHIGGSVTVTQFLESSIIRQFFPHLPEHLRLVSSTPIRNMATLAGNLVNASPIGDMTIFLLALDAELLLRDGTSERKVPLKAFYQGYKKLDKSPGEIVAAISFAPPAGDIFFNFEKVSKRTWLDIASVNSACQMTLDAGGVIRNIHLSAGGVGPTPKYLAATVAYLTGKCWSTAVFEEAVRIMNEEITPISDARGTAAYKRLLCRQLLAAHLQRAGLGHSILQNLLPA